MKTPDSRLVVTLCLVLSSDQEYRMYPGQLQQILHARLLALPVDLFHISLRVVFSKGPGMC